MPCKDCLSNCETIVSDQCVLYTGPDIPALGICSGMSLSQFENDIVTGLLNVMNGTAVIPQGVTINCKGLQILLGTKIPNVNNLLQLILDQECSLIDSVTALQAEIAAGQSGTVFDTACLQNLPANPKVDDIIQAIIFLLCSINTTVEAIPSTYVKNTDLVGQVTTIVNNINGSGNGSNTLVQQNTKMVPFVAYEYYGPLSNFDTTGKGVQALGYDKVYICNGNFGTPDKRGRVAVGAIRNIPGGSLDPAVDPVNPMNPNWAVNDKSGSNFHTNSAAEMVNHTHQVVDPGHEHGLGAGALESGNGVYKGAGGSGLLFVKNTDVATTGISVLATGGGQPYNTYQPSIAANFIMYIP